MNAVDLVDKDGESKYKNESHSTEELNRMNQNGNKAMEGPILLVLPYKILVPNYKKKELKLYEEVDRKVIEQRCKGMKHLMEVTCSYL